MPANTAAEHAVSPQGYCGVGKICNASATIGHIRHETNMDGGDGAMPANAKAQHAVSPQWYLPPTANRLRVQISTKYSAPTPTSMRMQTFTWILIFALHTSRCRSTQGYSLPTPPNLHMQISTDICHQHPPAFPCRYIHKDSPAWRGARRAALCVWNAARDAEHAAHGAWRWAQCVLRMARGAERAARGVRRAAGGVRAR